MLGIWVLGCIWRDYDGCLEFSEGLMIFVQFFQFYVDLVFGLFVVCYFDQVQVFQFVQVFVEWFFIQRFVFYVGYFCFQVFYVDFCEFGFVVLECGGESGVEVE